MHINSDLHHTALWPLALKYKHLCLMTILLNSSARFIHRPSGTDSIFFRVLHHIRMLLQYIS